LTLAIVVLLIIFARKVNWDEAWTAMRTSSLPLLALAIVANLSTLVVRGIRWWLLLRSVGAPSFWLAQRASFAGAGLNNILVANGGEAAKIMFITRATGVPTARVTATAAFDRLFDPLGFVALLAIGTFAVPFPPEIDRFRWPAVVVTVLLLAGLTWLAIRSRNPQATHPPAIDESLTGLSWATRLKRWLAEFILEMRALASGGKIVWLVLLTFAAWITQLATFAFAAAAAHVHLPLAGSLAALLAVNVSLIVRATPGNVGFFQFAYTLATSPFPISTDDAVAVSILIQALQIIPGTIVGVALAPEVLFRRRGRAKLQGETS
jgi:phosphatidylinositol alpha-mannosyltransferase